MSIPIWMREFLKRLQTRISLKLKPNFWVSVPTSSKVTLKSACYPISSIKSFLLLIFLLGWQICLTSQGIIQSYYIYFRNSFKFCQSIFRYIWYLPYPSLLYYYCIPFSFGKTILILAGYTHSSNLYRIALQMVFWTIPFLVSKKCLVLNGSALGSIPYTEFGVTTVFK